jgi:hypothetical protein
VHPNDVVSLHVRKERHSNVTDAIFGGKHTKVVHGNTKKWETKKYHVLSFLAKHGCIFTNNCAVGIGMEFRQDIFGNFFRD